MNEEQLKEKIRYLYRELLQEREGRYLNNDYKHLHEPNGYHYYELAEELGKKAIELSQLNPKCSFDVEKFKHTFEKEIEYVRDYEYEYNIRSNSIKPSSLSKMQHLMDKASNQIELDLSSILSDVDL